MKQIEKNVIVVISTYNGEKNITRQLESILQQTGVNVSVYIRDDSSTDKTVEVVKAFIFKNVMDSAFYHYDYNPESLTHSYDANRFEKIMKMYCYLKDKLNDIGMYDLCKFRLSNNFLGNARTTFKLEALGNANDLDAPGTIFSYQSYVREQQAMIPVLIDIFETNTGVK